jgi:hypothetical protein
LEVLVLGKEYKVVFTDAGEVRAIRGFQIDTRDSLFVKLFRMDGSVFLIPKAHIEKIVEEGRP